MVRNALDEWKPGDAVIVVTAGQLTPKSALRKLFEDHANAYAAGIYDDPPGRDEIEAALRTAGLRDIGREAMADLGVGDAALRRDRVWASAVPMGTVPEAPDLDTGPDPERELAELLEDAAATGALTREDRALLLDVAREAARLNVPARRGRGGLMTPSVAELVAEGYEASARTVRRRTARGCWRSSAASRSAMSSTSAPSTRRR